MVAVSRSQYTRSVRSYAYANPLTYKLSDAFSLDNEIASFERDERSVTNDDDHTPTRRRPYYHLHEHTHYARLNTTHTHPHWHDSRNHHTGPGPKSRARASADRAAPSD